MKFKYIFLAVLILVFLFVHFYLPRIITEIKSPMITAIKGNYYDLNSASFSDSETNGEFISFSSRDGTILKGYRIFSKLDTTKGAIILLHGIRSHKEHFITISNKIAAQGYDAIALDSRAHGESEGTHCTFGVKEKVDLKCLVDVLLQDSPHLSIGIWGQSLGGAIGLEALAYDSRIQYGIIESTFSDLNTITNDYLTNRIKFNLPYFSDYLLYRAGRIADFDPYESNPFQACSRIQQPILLAHGNQDKRIKIDYGRNNFSQLQNSRSEFLEIDGANHLNIWSIGGEKYFDKVFEFIEANHEKTINQN